MTTTCVASLSIAISTADGFGWGVTIHKYKILNDPKYLSLTNRSTRSNNDHFCFMVLAMFHIFTLVLILSKTTRQMVQSVAVSRNGIDTELVRQMIHPVSGAKARPYHRHIIGASDRNRLEATSVVASFNDAVDDRLGWVNRCPLYKSPMEILSNLVTPKRSLPSQRDAF